MYYPCTLSLEHNSILWLPMRTASTHASWVFAHFDFMSYLTNEENELKIDIISDKIHFGHELGLPPSHSSMSLISTARNPYERVFSFFNRQFVGRDIKPTQGEFEKFIQDLIENKTHFIKFFNKPLECLAKRVPDYIIRRENMYEDYLKIPFVKDSKLVSCGILEEMCNRRLNDNVVSYTSSDFYTDQIKEQVYSFIKIEFDSFGYSK
jgi:hypothetical protein